MPALTIEVFADVTCPWCYLGERRLRRALEEVCAEQPDLTVVRRWRPFELQPDLPPEGVAWRTFARTRFGGWERATVLFERMEQLGRAEGIRFRFDKIQKANHTRDAHRLILFARQHDREWAMVEALFAAYFTQGRDLNSRKDLRALVREVGLDEAAALDYLASGAGVDEIEASQQSARRIGVRGVPCYILNGHPPLVGAQPTALLAQALRAAIASPAGTNDPE